MEHGEIMGHSPKCSDVILTKYYPRVRPAKEDDWKYIRVTPMNTELIVT